MSARIPLQQKSPFQLDARPLEEMSSPHAGLLAASRAFRSLKLPDLIEANLQIKVRNRGFSEAQFIETLVLTQIAGADCPEDISQFDSDPCLRRGLGYSLPKVSAIRSFLDRFHDEQMAAERPEREVQKSFILPSSKPVQALQLVQAGMVAHIAKLYAEQNTALKIATVDQDATIIESHKRAALSHYEGGRGYQPMVAVWAEADLVLADEFRDGNVPARQEPLTGAKMAFDALPNSGRERYFRGDSACHENELIQWLAHPDRTAEPGGGIGFAISAVMSNALAKAVAQVPEKQWTTCATESDGTLQAFPALTVEPFRTTVVLHCSVTILPPYARIWDQQESETLAEGGPFARGNAQPFYRSGRSAAICSSCKRSRNEPIAETLGNE